MLNVGEQSEFRVSSGQTFYEAISSTPTMRDTKVLAMRSRFASNAPSDSARDGDATIAKPIRRSELLDELAHLCSLDADAPRTAGVAGLSMSKLHQADALPLNGLNVLIVEDNPVNSLVLSRVLESLGAAHVTTTANGVDAIGMVKQTSFDLVL